MPILGLLVIAMASHAAPIPAGWTCNGTCGTDPANGVVSLSPFAGSTGYQWVSTNNSLSTVALSGVGGVGTPQNGSTLQTTLFTVAANTPLTFYFNYITSDGAGYADYAWARLLDGTGNQVALLFTARTAPTGSVVPGFSMPSPTATLTPSSVPIIPGGPSWEPLGPDSGSCFDDGCGYTGWVRSSYLIPTAGSYRLEIGVTNWDDRQFASGLALDGVVAGDTVISGGGTVPEPGTFVFAGAGLVLAFAARRMRNR